MIKKIMLTTILLLAACSSPETYTWGTITEVDKDFKLIRTSRWHYSYRLEDGRVGNGISRSIIKKGWRIKVNSHGRVVEIREKK